MLIAKTNLTKNRKAALASLLALASYGFAGSPASTTLLDAVTNKDRASLRALLKGGADVNAAMGDGLTALHQAALDGDTETAQLLLYAGANVKATTRLGGYTPLLLAAKQGDAAMIDTLLNGASDPNATTTNGTSPLMFAAASGNVVAVNVLLQKGADLNAKEKAMGQNALMFAAANGRTDVVKVLLARGSDPKEATKVVDLFAFTKEAEEAFAAAAAIAPATPKKPEGEPKSDDPNAAAAPGAPAPDAATEAAKAAGLGGATTMSPATPATKSEPVGTKDAKPAESSDSKKADGTAKSSDKRDSKKAAKEAKEQEKKARDAKTKNALKDGPPKAELGSNQAQGSIPSPAPVPETTNPAATKTAAARPAAPAGPKKTLVGGVDRPFLYNEMVAYTGGKTPLLLAARQGHIETAKALLEAGADVNQISGGDKSSPLLTAVINGHFDLALYLLEKGADPRLASENGVTPLYAVVNVQWAPKAGYPQPRAYLQQKASHLDVMKALLDKGAPVNARLTKKVWYSGYNFDLSGVDETGATPFWRAAYASDVDAMKLLVAHGADPSLPTTKIAGRPRTGDAARDVKDVSGLPPVAVGGPAVTPLQAAAGAGYGEGFAANSHRFAPGGMLLAVKYLIEEVHADINAADHEGNTALHHAAARGDNEMIKYLVSKGANVMAVSREGRTVVDMANAPVSRIEPFPATIALLESMGAKNNHKCVSCDNGPVKAGGGGR